MNVFRKQLNIFFEKQSATNIRPKLVQGFTLIELLVVVSIIGMLGTVVIASLGGAKIKARDAQKMVTVQQVGQAVQLMYDNTGKVPGNYLRLDGTLSQTPLSSSEAKPASQTGPDDQSNSAKAYRQSMQDLVTAGVLPSIPNSPGGDTYHYFDYGGADGEGASFYTTFETTSGDGGSVVSSQPSTVKAPPCYHYGDVNDDGYVTEADITMTREGILGDRTLTGEQHNRADVNGINMTTTLDIGFIREYIIGNSITLPICDYIATVTNASIMGNIEVAVRNHPVTVFTPPGSSNLDFDLNSDNKVDLADEITVRNISVTNSNFDFVKNKLLTAIQNRISTKTGDAQYESKLDFNSNGQIDLVDKEMAQKAMDASRTTAFTILGVISGQIELENFLGTATTPPHTRMVTFVATDISGNVLKTWQKTLTNTSEAIFNYSLEDVPLSAKYISAKTAWNLRKKLDITFSQNQATTDFIGNNVLLGGDLDNSNSVDNTDSEILQNNWYTHNAIADINGDGFASYFDYTMINRNFNLSGDSE